MKKRILPYLLTLIILAALIFIFLKPYPVGKELIDILEKGKKVEIHALDKYGYLTE